MQRYKEILCQQIKKSSVWAIFEKFMRILTDQNIQRRQLYTFLQFYTASCQLFVILNDREIFDYSIDYQIFKFNQ
jgi:hypothetical protein